MSGMREYQCDGMPYMYGCGETVEVSRKIVRPGRKKTGWLFVWPIDIAGTEDRSGELLGFCPSCAAHVEAFERSRAGDAS